MSSVSTMVPHRKYQSFTSIASIIRSRSINCKYRILAKCTKHHPENIEDFSKRTKTGDAFSLFFVLYLKDASDGMLSVLFHGKTAERFLGIDGVQNLKDPECVQLEHIKKAMEMVMDNGNCLDLCIRSYRPKKKTLNYLLFKAFDTVLVHGH